MIEDLEAVTEMETNPAESDDEQDQQQATEDDKEEVQQLSNTNTDIGDSDSFDDESDKEVEQEQEQEQEEKKPTRTLPSTFFNAKVTRVQDDPKAAAASTFLTSMLQDEQDRLEKEDVQ